MGFLFPRTTAASTSMSGFGTTEILAPSRGVSKTALTVDTTSGGNHIVFATAGTKCWAIQIEAVTISGTINFNLWGFESNMANNARMAAVVSRYDSAGTFVSDVVANGNANHFDNIEYVVTTPTACTWSATPTSTTFAAGDWLVLAVHADAIGTMGAAAAGASFDYNAAVASDGDSSVQFTETIVAFTPPAGLPRVNPYPQLLAH